MDRTHSTVVLMVVVNVALVGCCGCCWYCFPDRMRSTLHAQHFVSCNGRKQSVSISFFFLLFLLLFATLCYHPTEKMEKLIKTDRNGDVLHCPTAS